MNRISQILALREGGRVQRCHTIPFVGEYNIAIHSYNALNLLFLLYPGTSMNLVKAVMWHDIPERWTGDVPAPAKWHKPPLKTMLDEIEQKVLKKLNLNTPFENLTAKEQSWLHGVDLLELYVFSLEQLHMGNNSFRPMMERVRNMFQTWPEKYPHEVVSVVYDLHCDNFYRIRELDELLGEAK